VIVNYDLPWAIIRLIQRAGRVDRVGQESDTVHVYLITHDKVEQQIRLRQRIRARLSAAAEAFGSDEQFFGTDDEINLLHNFYNGNLSDGDDDGEGEADAVSEAWLAWSNAQNSHPEVTKRVLGLPDLIHSTRDKYARESTGGVACFVRTESGVDAFAVSESAGALSGSSHQPRPCASSKPSQRPPLHHPVTTTSSARPSWFAVH
jgi:hypothetical protein